jgi:ribonuclease HI
MAKRGMTQKQALEIANEAITNQLAEHEDFEDSIKETLNSAFAIIEKMIAQKSKTRAKTETPTHKKNVNRVKKIHELAEGLDKFTWKWVVDNLNDVEVQTSQKVVALMRMGIADGKFEKFKEGKVTYYRAI